MSTPSDLVEALLQRMQGLTPEQYEELLRRRPAHLLAQPDAADSATLRVELNEMKSQMSAMQNLVAGLNTRLSATTATKSLDVTDVTEATEEQQPFSAPPAVAAGTKRLADALNGGAADGESHADTRPAKKHAGEVPHPTQPDAATNAGNENGMSQDDSDSDVDLSSGDYDPTPERRKKRAPLVVKPKPSLFKATVIELASSVRVGLVDVDDNVIAKMKKCLDRANHPNASEQEAKAALHLASKMMKQYNVTQAQVLAHIPQEDQKKYAGRSVVKLQRTDGDRTKNVMRQRFLQHLANPMEIFFDCKYYTSTRRSSSNTITSKLITFYGIAENTEAAARGFEMTYNLAVEWARSCKGTPAQTSYCQGVGVELQQIARKEKEAEEMKAKEAEEAAHAARIAKEKAERQAQVDRLSDLPRKDGPKLTQWHSATVEDEDEGGDVPFGAHSDKPASRRILSSAGASDNNAIDSARHDSDDSDAPVNMGYGDDDDDDDDLGQADFDDEDDDEVTVAIKHENLDDEIDKLVAAMPSRKSTTAQPREQSGDTAVSQSGAANDEIFNPTGSASQWSSHTELIVFRETAKRIADDYLKD